MPNQIVPRELIALAFVADEHAATSDIIGGLIPMFDPVLHQMDTEIFDPHAFAKKIRGYYGIPMNPLVARFLAPRMASAGLLSHKGGENYEINVRTVSPSPVNVMDSAKVDELLNGFCQFVREHASVGAISSEGEELKNEFLKRVKTEEILLSIDDWTEGQVQKGPEMPDIEKKHFGSKQKEVHMLDFYTGRYIQHLMENTPKEFETLKKFVVGVLIAEVVFALGKKPKSADLLQSLSVIIDAPLILDILDMHTAEQFGYAKNLLEMLKRSKVNLCAFEHSIKEMKDIIYAALKNNAGQTNHQNNNLSHMQVSHRMGWDQSAVMAAKELIKNPGPALERHGIKLINAEEFSEPEFDQFCSPEIEKSIVGILGKVVQGENIEGKHVDAKSVATTVRLRRGNTPTSMLDAKWIFITRNGQRAYQANRFLRLKGIVKSESISPVLTDRDIGGYLWFSTGAPVDQIEKIAIAKLVANCSAATEPSGGMLSALRAVMSYSPERQAQLSAIMVDGRARSIIADETIAERPEDMTLDLANSVAAKARKGVVAEAEAKKDAEFARERVRDQELWERERRTLKKAHTRAEEESGTLREDLHDERQKSARLEEQKEAAERREKTAEKQREKTQHEKEAALKQQQSQNEAHLRDILHKNAVKIFDAHCANIAKLIGIVLALLGVGCTFLLMLGFIPDTNKWFSAGGGVVGLLFWWAAAKTKLDKRALFHLSRKKAIRAKILQQADELGLPQDRLTIEFNNNSVWVGLAAAD